MKFSKECFVDLSQIIRDVDNYHAHPGEKPETLREHTNLCEGYFLRLLERRKLNSVFERVIADMQLGLSPEGMKCLIEMLLNVISFHDVGKVNPIFQSSKMKNKVALPAEEFQDISSTHSMLSAICYIHYFGSKIKRIAGQKERKPLIRILLMNAYIIAKHHGRLDDFGKFLISIQAEKGKLASEVFERTHKDFYIPEVQMKSEWLVKAGGIAESQLKKQSRNQQIASYIYERIIFSLLVTCDYYAVSEFTSDIRMEEYGTVDDIETITSLYRETKVSKWIKEYELHQYGRTVQELQEIKDVNVLRNEMYLDAWKVLKERSDESVFFLEAPTGSGKSNTAFNLSFDLVERHSDIQKIIYTYPFNTLVEQNLNTLSKVFDADEKIMQQIAVINSTTPIKVDQDAENRAEQQESSPDKKYIRALLNRQFMNYPIMLTTHVSLFHMMFGNTRENGGSFYQLANSVIVLDEIQSYKNSIWAEIIIFLKTFAKLLNIKVIIMSATLPDIDVLSNLPQNVIRLIENREKYFSHNLFKNRVVVHYDLMKEKMELQRLIEIVKEKSGHGKKILVEFIKKDHAFQFYRELKQEVNDTVELLTGEDSIAERERILNKINDCSEQGIILVATQVVEAGVDIDMDIGYKNYSKLDSEEQFMGRINRSCKRHGDVFFFDMDDPKGIYKNDVRINELLTIKKAEMQQILEQKNFADYYKVVLDHLQENNESSGEQGLEDFFKNKVGMLDFTEVEKRMRLINNDEWSMDVYLARTIKIDNEELDGSQVWSEYAQLLENTEIGYAKKQVMLSRVRSKMNHFIYQIKKNQDLCYSDKIGELYYLHDGEQYFQDNKLIREKFENQVGLFIDL